MSCCARWHRGLSDCLRANDVVARLGGDEFVVLLHAVPGAPMVAALARNILSAIMRPVEILGQECRVTASVGICLHPVEGQDDQSIMKNADMAMYLAKESGKNNFMFYSARMQAHAAGRLAMETNLRRALELQELSLHYQAKVDFKTGVITGVEALLRWNNPALGAVSPTQFIPVAEETGMIVPIGRWVLRTACAQNAEWQRMGLPPVCISVNLSMRQLQHDGLIDEIKAALFDSGMPPQLLELEITESMFMHNVDRTVGVLTAIKDLGVRLAIDDFGTGDADLRGPRRGGRDRGGRPPLRRHGAGVPAKRDEGEGVPFHPDPPVHAGAGGRRGAAELHREAEEGRLMAAKRICVFPGDGIGPEVVREGLSVLRVIEQARRDRLSSRGGDAGRRVVRCPRGPDGPERPRAGEGVRRGHARRGRRTEVG